MSTFVLAVAGCGDDTPDDTTPDLEDETAETAEAATGTERYGLLANGKRDKRRRPFSTHSIWNTPIGSLANYQHAGISPNMGGGYPTLFYQDEDVVVMKPSAPMTPVHYNGVGWTGGDRCAVEGGVVTTVPVPASYTLGNGGGNNSASFLMPDRKTIAQNQPFTRCAAGGPATTLVKFADQDIYGPGILGAHGGSGLSALGGTIRVGELRSGRIAHAMKVNLWAAQYYHCCSPQWPAVTVDGYANGQTYGGSRKQLGPGALLALPPSFDIAGLRTKPARILARAFQDYGAYVTDDTYSNSWAIVTEQGPHGRVVDEFKHLYGFSMRPDQGSTFMKDITDIFTALRIVTNNGPAHIGGGGAPRVPMAPPIGN